MADNYNAILADMVAVAREAGALTLEHFKRFRAALGAGKPQDFVDDALAAAPAADFIYLDWRIVTYSADAGFDIVAAFTRRASASMRGRCRPPMPKPRPSPSAS